MEYFIMCKKLYNRQDENYQPVIEPDFRTLARSVADCWSSHLLLYGVRNINGIETETARGYFVAELTFNPA